VLELAVRVVVSLGVVLGLFWTVARFGSRRIGGRDRTLVRVRSRQVLSRGSSLAVVEVGSRVLVVGVSDGGVRLLTELDPVELETAPDTVPDTAPDTAVAFGADLSAAFKPYTAPSTAPVYRGTHRATTADLADVADLTALVDLADLADRAPAGSTASSRAAAAPARPSGAPAAVAVAQRRRPVADPGPLGGSLLAPATWRQAWATATRRGERTADGGTA
jgi:flagellar protein FliO/FliZ